MRTLVLTIFLLPLISGCSMLNPFSSDPGTDEELDPVKAEKEAKAEEVDPYVRPSSAEEMELTLAKIWARVDELEEVSYRQKEKIRVLQKGLMLGVVPEEIKSPGALTPPPPVKKKKKKPTSKMTKKEQSKYQKMLAEAHAHFREGRYGRAIKSYSAIGDEFEGKLPDGMHEYWIARSWANLKELNIAHQRYVDFMKNYPKSTWVPRARLDKARVELTQGLRETAIKNFRNIIKEYPYEDVAEMARMELERMETTL